MNDDKDLFLKIRKNQPIAGDCLESIDKNPIKLTVRTKNENGEEKTVIFCRAIVDVKQGGWYLSCRDVGIVCMILPDSQKSLVKDGDGDYLVNALKVIRYTRSGRAMLCEVI